MLWETIGLTLYVAGVTATVIGFVIKPLIDDLLQRSDKLQKNQEVLLAKLGKLSDRIAQLESRLDDVEKQLPEELSEAEFYRGDGPQ